MTSVDVRIIAPDRATLERAVVQLRKGGDDFREHPQSSLALQRSGCVVLILCALVWLSVQVQNGDSRSGSF
jgi:hypothetical protein